MEEVSGQSHTPSFFFYPRWIPQPLWTMGNEKNVFLCRKLDPDPPARSRVTKLTELPPTFNFLNRFCVYDIAH